MSYLICSFLTICTFSQLAMGETMTMTADEMIQALELQPLPEEGGYYRETYRGGVVNAPANAFGINSPNPRTVTTAIYYLVTPKSFSALHRVKSDEIFHFYDGDPVEMIQIDKDGNLSRFVIGNDIVNGQTPQVVVKKGDWQALRLMDGGKWSLMGTTVSPGFEFEDFEIGPRDQLLSEFPQHAEDIIRFTREPSESTH